MSNSGCGDVTEVFLNGFIFLRRRRGLNRGSKDRPQTGDRLSRREIFLGGEKEFLVGATGLVKERSPSRSHCRLRL